MNVNDTPIFIDPPDILMQRVQRLRAREAFRLAKKFGKLQVESEAYLYSSEEAFYIEAGNYRMSFPLDGEWYGCVSLSAHLLLGFWNSLPKGEMLTILYERGWLSLESLSVGRALWQPKYDPDWMTR